MSNFISRFFGPQLPYWACEFTERGLIVASVGGSRKRIGRQKVFEAPPGMVVGSLSDKNLPDPVGAQEAVRAALREAGFRGSEIGVVVPDNSTRIAFMTAETLPKAKDERDSFIRWKLKKTMPFDVEKAQVAVKVLGQHVGGDAEGIDLLVALCPKEIVDEYVGLMSNLDIHAGLVVPSTLAALNLVHGVVGDTLFVKVATGCISTTILQDKRIQFSRRVAEMPLYDAVYPTFQYYQDKLAGRGFQRIVVCSEQGAATAVADLQQKLGVQTVALEPNGIEDIYKPALGAVGLLWASIT